jgi:ribosome-associated protein
LSNNLNFSGLGIGDQEINELIIDSIQDIKGKNILQLDLRGISGAPADYFIVCQGDSTVQLRAIAGNIYKRMKEEANSLPLSFEGRDQAKWVLVDYFNTVVHVFHPELREFYDLEGLWRDAVITEIEDV